jgi:hypothetical protein
MSDSNARSVRWDIVKWLTIVSLAVGIVAALWKLYDEYIKPDPPAVRVQYVVDVSKDMGGRIGKVEKLAAVKDEILSAVKGTPDIAYSLRVAGPNCSNDYTRPAVDFGEDNDDEFENALAPLRAGGTSDFARAVRYAVNDLVEQQQQEGTESVSLYFLIGGQDGCTKRPGEVIDRSLAFLGQKKTSDVTFKFVGVKAPDDLRKLLRRTRRRAKLLGFGATVNYANTADEIGESVQPPEPEPTPASP